jgi:hypothetical protein
MFIGPNLWDSNYKARAEMSAVEYILASHFDDIFLDDLKESFENCLRVDSGNSLVSPFNFGNYRAINLADPVSDTDAANKRYLNAQIYRFEGITNNNDAYGNIQLATNKIYSMLQTGPITFVLPTPTNMNVLNQIMIDLKTNAAGNAVNLGTDKYFTHILQQFAPDGHYTVIYEYSNQMGGWVVGILIKGAVN